MPNYELHRKIGFIVSFIFISIMSILLLKRVQLPINILLWLPFVILIYSNLPDLDHHMSKLRKYLFRILFILLFFSLAIFIFMKLGILLAILTIVGLVGLLILSVKHRGPLHTYWCMFLFSLPLFLIHWFIFLIGIVASFTHVFVDRTYSSLKRKVRKIFNMQNQTKNININFRW